MPQYEVNVILSPNLDVAQAAAEKDIIKASLERHGAEVKNADDWGTRRLAYPIQKNPDGTVLFYTVELGGATNAALEKELRLRDHVRRVTIIRDRPEWRKTKSRKKPASRAQ